MFNSVEIFLNELNEIDNYINYLEATREILRLKYNAEILKNFKKNHNKIKVKIRQYEYKLLIISVYGSIEKLFENTIKEYIEKLNKNITEYGELPLKIRENNFLFSAKLIEKMTKSSKYTNVIEKEEIIEKLYTTIKKVENYELNAISFTDHSTNFRLNSINEFFSKVDIIQINDKIKLNKFFNEKKEEASLIEMELLEFDNLAERRNRVSHGENEDEILSIDEIKNLIRFFKIYGETLKQVLNNEFFKIIENKGILLGKTSILYNKKIIGFRLKNIEFEKGDFILVNGQVSKIINIRVNNNEDYSKIKLINDEEADVSLELEDKIATRMEYKLFRNKYEIKN
ncbi:MAG: HEPN domain-containing protein [Cetobacterium sp.]|uniref:HEPN domain-containing protein n=1 Tax=Cetobacterium sp. TaxID=2071632 RepID=UPI003F3B31FE